jgi:hypothetical protein
LFDRFRGDSERESEKARQRLKLDPLSTTQMRDTVQRRQDRQNSRRREEEDEELHGHRRKLTEDNEPHDNSETFSIPFEHFGDNG